MEPIGIYIHVPFCECKCPYCDFYSVKVTPNLINKYTDIICKKLIEYGKSLNRIIDTLYFGGGTPSLLGNANLSKIISAVKNNFDFLGEEITLEINPTTLPILDFEKLRIDGVNRLSIGLQSAINKELELLGRSHNVKDAEKTIKLAQSAGFNNISLDLMIATPEQTMNTLKESINFCINQNIQHISAYLLKIEEGTPFYRNRKMLKLKGENEETNMYLFLVSELESNGFYQYEISNFSKKGFESKHNLKYWNTQEYLGIGPSAHSFIGGKRFFYPRSLKHFLSGDCNIIEDGVGGTIEEYIMLRLRLRQGLSNDMFKKRFGYDIPKIYFERAKAFQKYNLVYIDDQYIKLTPKGFLLSNKLISEIIL